MHPHLVDLRAEVVGPPLAALLADPAGEVPRYGRPLPVAVHLHHRLQHSARESTDRSSDNQYKFISRRSSIDHKLDRSVKA